MADVLPSRVAGEQVPMPAPVVRQISKSDLKTALIYGWNDFKAAPQYGLFFGLLYATGGWAIILLATVSGFYYLAYPLAAGFALIAPFVAAGIYEVSRRLELELPLGWSEVIEAIKGGGRRDLGWMALVTTFTFFIWIDIAIFLYAMFFGMKGPGPWVLISEILTTSNGLMFFLTGNVIGAMIAFAVFSLTVVSFPLLLDRDVDFVTAMITSVRAVKANLVCMIYWAITIALLTAVSLLTGLLGLIIVLPWLGHASWHVYRLVVVTKAERQARDL